MKNLSIVSCLSVIFMLYGVSVAFTEKVRTCGTHEECGAESLCVKKEGLIAQGSCRQKCDIEVSCLEGESVCAEHEGVRACITKPHVRAKLSHKNELSCDTVLGCSGRPCQLLHGRCKTNQAFAKFHYGSK